MVTSDHGEEFGEHGGAAHARTLYQEHAIVHDDFKVVRDLTSGQVFGFDLASDPHERSQILPVPPSRQALLMTYEELMADPQTLGFAR